MRSYQKIKSCKDDQSTPKYNHHYRSSLITTNSQAKNTDNSTSIKHYKSKQKPQQIFYEDNSETQTNHDDRGSLATVYNDGKIIALRQASASLFVDIMRLQDERDRIKNSHHSFRLKLSQSSRLVQSAKQQQQLACESLNSAKQYQQSLMKELQMLQQRLRYYQGEKSDYTFRWDLQKTRFLLMRPEVDIDCQLEQHQDLEMVLGKPCKFYPVLDHARNSQFSFLRNQKGFIVSLKRNHSSFVKLCSRMSYPSKGRYCNKFTLQAIRNNQLILGLTNHCSSQYNSNKKQLYLNFCSSFIQHNGTKLQPFDSTIHTNSTIQLIMDMSNRILICVVDSQQRVFTVVDGFDFQFESIYLFLAVRDESTAVSFSNMIS